jgi:hypothetical protein
MDRETTAASRMTANRRTLWLALLTAASLVFSYGLACAAPLAAFAAIGALTLPRRDAIVLVVAVWLANQAAGFVLLDYPTTANSIAWGVAIGAAASLGLFGAQITAARMAQRNPITVWIVAFLAAFVVYQVALFIPGAVALGGLASFAPAVVLEVFLLNAMAFAGLAGFHRIGIATGLAEDSDARSLAA